MHTGTMNGLPGLEFSSRDSGSVNGGKGTQSLGFQNWRERKRIDKQYGSQQRVVHLVTRTQIARVYFSLIQTGYGLTRFDSRTGSADWIVSSWMLHFDRVISDSNLIVFGYLDSDRNFVVISQIQMRRSRPKFSDIEPLKHFFSTNHFYLNITILSTSYYRLNLNILSTRYANLTQSFLKLQKPLGLRLK